MYNLENTYWYSEHPLSDAQLASASAEFFVRQISRDEETENRTGWVELDHIDEYSQDNSSRRVYLSMLNHFPTRTMTFVHSRAFLANEPRGHFYYRSRYRGVELNSCYQLMPLSENQLQVIRKEPQ